jgi:tRNA pseudouridine13 synthase
VKENWETHHLLRDMARQLCISDERIGIAGIKDKRAITTSCEHPGGSRDI